MTGIESRYFLRINGHPRYELLWYVYKPLSQPHAPNEVTLYHLYRRLSKSLLEWPKWEQFVTGLHPKLFDLAGIRQEDLLRNPLLLRAMYRAISEERKQRLTANVSVGESELVDLPSKVHQYQKDVVRKKGQLDAIIAKNQEKLEEMFPELQHLGR